MRFTHICSAAKCLSNTHKCSMLIFIEVMHLLPQSFGVQTAHSSSQGRLLE